MPLTVIVPAPGGGGPGYPVLPAARIPVGQQSSANALYAGSQGPVAVAAGAYWTTPLPIADAWPGGLATVSCYVSVAGPADSVVRFGLWADDRAGGGPGAKVDDGGTQPLEVPGWCEGAFSAALAPGLYWVTALPSAACQLLGLATVTLAPLGIQSWFSPLKTVCGYGAAGGNPANPFPARHPDGNWILDGKLPLVWLTRRPS
jgi:hypothetical protein